MPADEDILCFRPNPRSFIGQALPAGVLGFLILFFSIRMEALLPVAAGIVLWAYIKPLFHYYRLTTDRIIYSHGLISRSVRQIELHRVKDIIVSQGILGRILNYGDVVLISADKRAPDIRCIGILSPLHMKEQLRDAFLKAHRKHGIRGLEVHKI